MLSTERNRRHVVGFPALRVMLAMTLVAWSVEGVRADPAGTSVLRQDAIRGALSRAGRNVDEAWETFHRAALGGTLASPAIQTKIEQALHEARQLLVAARVAAQSGNQRAVFALTRRIEDMSAQIQHDSRMRKP